MQRSQRSDWTCQIPIYDQGQTNYNVAVAASQLDQANAGLIADEAQVESDVRSALANLISARASLVQAKAEQRAAQVSLDATQAQYKVGANTILGMVTAEANLSTAHGELHRGALRRPHRLPELPLRHGRERPSTLGVRATV